MTTQAPVLERLRRGGGCGRARHEDPAALRRCVPGFLTGSDRAASVPRLTHLASCGRLRTAVCIDAQPAPHRASAHDRGTGLGRTHQRVRLRRVHPDRRPPWPLAATARCPPTRKARPPNIFFSLSPRSPRATRGCARPDVRQRPLRQIVDTEGARQPGRRTRSPDRVSPARPGAPGNAARRW